MPFAGTGLFVGSADALQNGGPIGALLAYSLMGTVVYCLCISVGEIISFLYVCLWIHHELFALILQQTECGRCCRTHRSL